MKVSVLKSLCIVFALVTLLGAESLAAQGPDTLRTAVVPAETADSLRTVTASAETADSLRTVAAFARNTDTLRTGTPQPTEMADSLKTLASTTVSSGPLGTSRSLTAHSDTVGVLAQRTDGQQPSYAITSEGDSAGTSAEVVPGGLPAGGLPSAHIGLSGEGQMSATGDLSAGDQPSATAEISTEDRLKAKVDSLRNALSELSPERRRASASRLLAEADSLRLAYDFPRAVEAYRRALGASADSAQTQRIADAMTLGQNGLSMMNYCSHPNIVARQTFALEDFFLYYPMRDGVWRRSPNVLDDSRDIIAQATLVPDDARTVYYSARDGEGTRNIYRTERSGEEWTVPQLLNEELTSNSDEIYPVLSPDGRTLYFASKGLYGMGGYDLYMSQWNRETRDWSAPINMGFPYSSPYDDFLFVNTEDGKYSVFASNRDCAQDSVTIYVLEFDAMPLRRAVSDVRELRILSALSPGGSRPVQAQPETEAGEEGVNVRAYVEKMTEVRALRDSIYAYNKGLDSLRSALADIPADEQSGYVAAILARETGLPAMQKRLDAAVSSLQSIELEFLASGVVIDPAKLQDEPEAVEPSRSFDFTRHRPGTGLHLTLMEPEPSFDYTFRIGGEGQFAENQTIPDGLVYQIQIASGSRRLTVNNLKGLSPVFEKMATSLRYTYAVGVFRSYNDVLSHLNSVRTAGFRDAFIVAYRDGERVSVSEARAMESTFESRVMVTVTLDSGAPLPDLAKTAIRQRTSADILRRDADGVTTYQVGPFADREDAEALVTALRATGVTRVTISE